MYVMPRIKLAKHKQLLYPSVKFKFCATSY